MLMPGARNLRIVTTKLSEPAIDETPSNKVPSTRVASRASVTPFFRGLAVREGSRQANSNAMTVMTASAAKRLSEANEQLEWKTPFSTPEAPCGAGMSRTIRPRQRGKRSSIETVTKLNRSYWRL